MKAIMVACAILSVGAVRAAADVRGERYNRYSTEQRFDRYNDGRQRGESGRVHRPDSSEGVIYAPSGRPFVFRPDSSGRLWPSEIR